ncbi:MAG: hypothetical protein HN580_02260 [Deltaproteobacteria bacterium]|nr:hypothetical protein [Deltaproteobacteria bacterium]MBT7887820.1 hypothetical protein [Deltaproteobacteria bacterium]
MIFNSARGKDAAINTLIKRYNDKLKIPVIFTTLPEPRGSRFKTMENRTFSQRVSDETLDSRDGFMRVLNRDPLGGAFAE